MVRMLASRVRLCQWRQWQQQLARNAMQGIFISTLTPATLRCNTGTDY